MSPLTLITWGNEASMGAKKKSFIETHFQIWTQAINCWCANTKWENKNMDLTHISLTFFSSALKQPCSPYHQKLKHATHLPLPICISLPTFHIEYIWGNTFAYEYSIKPTSVCIVTNKNNNNSHIKHLYITLYIHSYTEKRQWN